MSSNIKKATAVTMILYKYKVGDVDPPVELSVNTSSQWTL